MNQRERISYLLQLYADNNCSREEFEELFELVLANDQADGLDLAFSNLWKDSDSHPQNSDNQWEALYNEMMEKHHAGRFQWKKIAVAASVLLISSVVILTYFGRDKNDLNFSHNRARSIAELAPGGNNAILTLADGKKIILNERAKGPIASQSGISITKSAQGQLIYSISKKAIGPSASGFNTIETPKGGQYQLIMPDGTRVWLNAMSSLKFPVNFGATERKVELNGEGYFEVAHNKKIPFRVSVPGQQLEVLGTHFNVNAYANEKAIRTTLLEGSVMVQEDAQSKQVILSPGMQSVIAGGKLSVKEVDTELAVAWKNGSFVFNNDNLEGIMRQVSRWYDVDVEYKNEGARARLFSGSISRFENASQVLDILELTGMVHFKVEGRRITVI